MVLKLFSPFIEGYIAANPELHIDIRHIIAEGDIAVTHSRLTLNPKDRGMAIADIFRVENSKFVEHRDVIQPYPKKLQTAKPYSKQSIMLPPRHGVLWIVG